MEDILNEDSDTDSEVCDDPVEECNDSEEFSNSEEPPTQYLHSNGALGTVNQVSSTESEDE